MRRVQRARNLCREGKGSYRKDDLCRGIADPFGAGAFVKRVAEHGQDYCESGGAAAEPDSGVRDFCGVRDRGANLQVADRTAGRAAKNEAERGAAAGETGSDWLV